MLCSDENICIVVDPAQSIPKPCPGYCGTDADGQLLTDCLCRQNICLPRLCSDACGQAGGACHPIVYGAIDCTDYGYDYVFPDPPIDCGVATKCCCNNPPQGGADQTCSATGCEPPLHCCDDDKCHECCDNDDCPGSEQCDPSTHTCVKPEQDCRTNADCGPTECCTSDSTLGSDAVTPPGDKKDVGSLWAGTKFICTDD